MVLFSVSSPQSSELFWEFSSGLWTGGAYKEENGQFSHCAVWAKYESGISFGVALTRSYDLRFLLQNNKWELPLEGSYKVRVSIDEKDFGLFDAFTSNEKGLIVDLGNNMTAFNLLKFGRVLRIQASKDTFTFNLKGTNKALSKVKEYVDVASRFNPDNTNPFSEESERKTRSQGQRDDDSKVIHTLLNGSGLENVELVDPDQLDWPSAKYAWQSGRTVGAMFIMDYSEEEGLDELFQSFIGKMAGKCSGTFGSKSGDLLTVGKSSFKQFYAFCNSTEDYYIAATAIVREEALLFVINFTDRDSNDLVSVNEKMGNILKVLMTN